ncbi:MAG TPA: DUF302 domain-containing protein [Anaeromyxobacteraceae bacterium]|nr:DUF302 domain-containing protein [Anaeromyxobacteraceae bacterium]
MPGFTLQKKTELRFEDVLARLPELLKAEGFGVLTQIDVKETLKQKIGVDFRRYRILGACNPRFAHQALSADLEVGAMLPCNVVVYEGDDGKAVVMAIDPMQTMAAANPQVRAVAEQVRERLERVVARVT